MDDRETTFEETTQRHETSLSFQGTTKEVVDRYTHCILCGANLHFSHNTDFGKNLTQETAKCPECGIRVSQVIHRLQ